MERRQLLGNLALLGGVTLVLLWVFDAAVAFWPKPPDQEQRLRTAAARAGVSLDPRSALQVMQELRDSVAIYPAVYMGNHWQQRPQFRDTIMPLGGISGVRSLMCNEGDWIAYHADEHGFTNPAGAFGQRAVAVATVGDSYTQGWCVPMERSFVALLRQDHPSLVSLGFGASGPLMQLGQMREYLPALRPRRVLWFYYERNDLDPDLRDELTHPVLRRYLDSSFTQGLAGRQGEIDRRLRAFLVAEESAAAARALKPKARRDWPRTFVKVVKLYDLRMLLARARAPDPPPTCCDLAQYREVVRQAQALVQGWGGELRVVYLPSEARLSGRRTIRASELAADSVLGVLRGLGVPVLDLRESILRYGSGRDLHRYEESHYNERGHRAVALLVQAWLAADTAAGTRP